MNIYRFNFICIILISFIAFKAKFHKNEAALKIEYL